MAPKTEKDAMVAELSSLVKAIAQRIASRMPPHIEVDDLISAGMIGLLDAFDKFDSAKSNNFKKYAEVPSVARSSTRCARWTRWVAASGARRRSSARPSTSSSSVSVAPRPRKRSPSFSASRSRATTLMHQLQPILVVSVEELSDEGATLQRLTDRLPYDPYALLEAKRVRDFSTASSPT